MTIKNVSFKSHIQNSQPIYPDKSWNLQKIIRSDFNNSYVLFRKTAAFIFKTSIFYYLWTHDLCKKHTQYNL